MITMLKIAHYINKMTRSLVCKPIPHMEEAFNIKLTMIAIANLSSIVGSQEASLNKIIKRRNPLGVIGHKS